MTRCSSQHLPPSQPSTSECCCCSGSKCQGGHSTATAPQQRRDHHNYNSCSGLRAHFLMAAGGWRVGLLERYQTSLKLRAWESESPGMFVVNIQPSVRSELLDRVLKRGESLSSVTLISLLIFNLNSLQFGCNTEAECSQPRTPQSNSSVWEKTESSSM